MNLMKDKVAENCLLILQCTHSSQLMPLFVSLSLGLNTIWMIMLENLN